jgi:hypothetical protein
MLNAPWVDGTPTFKWQGVIIMTDFCNDLYFCYKWPYSRSHSEPLDHLDTLEVVITLFNLNNPYLIQTDTDTSVWRATKNAYLYDNQLQKDANETKSVAVVWIKVAIPFGYEVTLLGIWFQTFREAHLSYFQWSKCLVGYFSGRNNQEDVSNLENETTTLSWKVGNHWSSDALPYLNTAYTSSTLLQKPWVV